MKNSGSNSAVQGGQLGLQNDSLEEEAVYIDTEGNVHKRGVKTN
jgi:hypothetical protein